MATPRPHDAVFKTIFEQRVHAIALFQYMLMPACAEIEVWADRVLFCASLDEVLADSH